MDVGQNAIGHEYKLKTSFYWGGATRRLGLRPQPSLCIGMDQGIEGLERG